MTSSDISIRREDGIVVVTPVGEMDAVTSPALAEVLDGILSPDPPHGVVVDFTKVGFCDSRCIGVLVAAYRQARDLGLGLVVAAPMAMAGAGLFGVALVVLASARVGWDHLRLPLRAVLVLVVVLGLVQWLFVDAAHGLRAAGRGASSRSDWRRGAGCSSALRCRP